MKYTPQEVIQFIQEEDVKFIRLAFCDCFGRPKNISIMPHELERAFKYGIAIDASAIAGFGDEVNSDLFLHPDASTIALLPWRPEHGSVVRMFCSITHPDGTPFAHDTRGILKQAVADAAKAGYAFSFGSELEFYLFRLDENGEVLRWAVSCDRGQGYIDGENVRMTEEEALAQYDDALYQRHAARGDAWGGGDAAGLDYYPTEKPAFTDNVMPDEVRALYLNGSAIQYADSYIRLAQGTGINAFVVDIVDGTAVSYASPVMQQYSPSAYAAAQDTMEGFKANVQKLRDAGYYVIGRITAFNDAHLAADHPEYVISDLNGTPLKISSMYWPSAYNRTVWQYKVELALEAAALGFNEIQFDYIRFPDGAYKYEQAGTIDYKNTYGESKAQAVQRFLIYAAERLHDAGYYISGDVFGECANAYVTACGQYWPAISSVVDAISGMPYPDHYSAQGDYKPWEHPYTTVHNFGESAMARQSETASPGAVRTWIQCYNAIREPYNHYGAAELADEVRALRDAGCTGGFMTWNGASDIDKYAEVISALS